MPTLRSCSLVPTDHAPAEILQALAGVLSLEKRRWYVVTVHALSSRYALRRA